MKGETLGHQLVDASLPLDVIAQGVVLAQLKQDVDVFCVLENMDEFHDICVL